MTRTILCVEDERRILENNRKAFADMGYKVLTAETLAHAREYLARESPDAIVLDIMLPDGNGLDLLSELRANGNQVPVIMLTAWGKPEDVARGLKAGANDYLPKPFEYKVLLARVEAMLRNVEQLPQVLTRGALTLKIMSDEAYCSGENLNLTQKEFSLLVVFVQHQGRIMSAEYLYEQVWGKPMAGDPNAVKKAISNLRKKLSGCGYTVSNEYRGGYRFERGE